MANIVDLLIGLGIDAGDYDAGLNAADQHSSSFIDRMTGPLTSAVVGAFAVGGAAVAGFAADSVSHFADFQASMNEVFTLLPGISADAMHDMTDQVKTFSKDFGVLPEKVVPALYQSLSAGVPPDNVFKFLESANKAATAGVTDLSVAVDGISSVVNAYGSDVIDATKASDLMFTAVKLGKTNFEQLSSSLFNVTPAASAAGVEFKTVTAALAAMTLQGVPTNVATTKLRAAINELSQAGTKTDKIFRQVAGQSFKEFIASGGDMQGALQLLEKHAKDTNVGINDLFGSVDAGSAALLLTGKGTDAFSNALKGMDESAGATDQAFATMNTGITDAIDDMRAVFAVFQLEVGERLAPIIQFLADKLGVILPIALQTATDLFDRVSNAINNLIRVFDTSGGSVSALFTIFEDGSSSFTNFLQALGVSEDVALAINSAFSSLVDALKPLMPLVNQLGKLIGDNLQPILLAVGTVLAVVIVGAIVSFIGAIIAAAAPVIAIIAVVAALYAAFNSNFLGIRDTVTNVMNAVLSVVSTVVGFIRTFWAQNGADIVATVTEHFGTIQTTISDVLRIIDIIITTVLTSVMGFIDRHGTQISAILNNTWTIIKNVISAAVTLISGIIHAFLQILQGDWAGAWLTIKNTAASFVTQIWAAIKAGVDNILITWTIVWTEVKTVFEGILNSIVGWVIQTFNGIVSTITSFSSKVSSAAASVGEGIVSGITKAIENGVGAIVDAAKNAAMSALNAAKNALGIGSPSKLAINEIGQPFVQGIIIGVDQMLGAVASAGGRASAALTRGATATAPAISGSSTVAHTVGSAHNVNNGVNQTFNIDAHYSKYEDERSLRDTIRMESALAM